MDYNKYKTQFSAKAKNAGYSEDNISRCLAYAKPILEEGYPVIFNTTHLSSLVGYNKNYLKRAVAYQKYFYREFSITKKNGELRTLREPLPSLKEIQSWILNNILYKHEVSRYAKGYIPKRSIKDHAKYHTNELKVLTLDIKSFFDSISFGQVEAIFSNIGYSNIVSNLLAKLCFLEKNLPQGAPTSPCISNILLLEFDNVISAYCSEKKIKYTRYADDLAFSGDVKKTALIKLVRSELKKLGLRLNNQKIKLMKQSQPQIISGIIVNKKVQVPKKNRNKIRNEMFYIKKFGFQSHMEKTKQTKSNYLKHLIGRINYLLTLNPKDTEFLEYKKILYQLESTADNSTQMSNRPS
ncbi:MAG: reverse transcriptase [Crocinitomicaceae bacterium]|nr:reverse transcriptase [Crocinitomicaceae bacterium]|tara:strand:- start:9407 stop:10465 length:1059 start_codon:yes stop_codon:yes gene_type:complete